MMRQNSMANMIGVMGNKMSEALNLSLIVLQDSICGLVKS